MERKTSSACSREKATIFSKWKSAATNQIVAALGAGDGHPFDAYRRSSRRTAKLKVIGDRDDVAIHVLQVSGNRDLFHRICQFTVLDPEAGSSLRVISSNEVHSEAHRLRNVKAVLYVADQNLWRALPGLEVEVVRTDSGITREPTRGTPGRAHTE